MRNATREKRLCQQCERVFETSEKREGRAKYCNFACYALHCRKNEESWDHAMRDARQDALIQKDMCVTVNGERYLVENGDVQANLTAETLMWDEWKGRKVIVGYRHG